MNVVGHLAVDEEGITVAVYQTYSDDNSRIETLRTAEEVVSEMSNLRILSRKLVTSDIASQLLIDNADIGISRTADGWRFLIKARSSLEHSRLVRMAQVLGASLSQQRPWPLIAYEALQDDAAKSGEKDWPRKAQISGIVADPDRHARVFVPKTIALLSFFCSFAFACRSMVREFSNNTIFSLLSISRGAWLPIVMSKVLVSSAIGLLALWVLISFACATQGFYLKQGVLMVVLFQFIGIVTSALLGVACSLFAKNEVRIYLIGSSYLIILVLLSGLIAKISSSDVLLYWLSSIVPLLYAIDVLADWMFFGASPSFDSGGMQIMISLLIVSAVTTFASVGFYRRTL